MSAANLLSKFRNSLATHKLQAYIIPTADAHQSEYVSSSDMRRAFISGFDGSAGTSVITTDKALLWTDGRYFLQASKQLDSSCWELMKQGLDGVPNLDAWLSTNLPSGSTVGCDPFLLSVSQYKAWETTLAGKGVKLVGVEGNLVDQVWEGKPALPHGVIKTHPVSVAGESVESKLAKIRAKMVENKAYATVVCALDEIAWLFNLRGADITFNPVFLSYALITPTTATLYVDASKFSEGVSASLAGVCDVKGYGDIITDMQDLKATLVDNKTNNTPYKLWIDAGKSNVAVYTAVGFNIGKGQAVSDSEYLLETPNPIALMKAIKNDVEIEGMKQAHIRDGVAMVKFLAWFEQQYSSLPPSNASAEAIKQSPWSEYTVSNELEKVRQQGDKFVGLSFDTISSVGPNGAIVHYKPDEHTSSPVTSGQVYLLDSGAQYLDGTTDITRTFWIPGPHAPEPSEFQKETYTRVLQGHIALSNALFPANTMGPALDALARMYLWSVGLNFMHGTGHGVGSYLNVHEGPHGIAMMNRGGTITTTPLTPGMVVSNEPGYYHDGEFGIRIENLVYVTKKEAKYSKDYYGFENLTMVPIDRALIDVKMLSGEHIDWFNKYNTEIRAIIGPLVENDKVAHAWLIKNTEPLQA